MDDFPLSCVLNAALEIAGRRRETLEQLRAALEKGDDTQALGVARALCGVVDVQESRPVRHPPRSGWLSEWGRL
jgi:hypothetical protein